MKNLISGLFVLAMGLASSSTFAATYNYTGANYTIFGGSYTAADSVSGSFSTASPLAPDLVNADLAALATSWSFFDGVTTVTDAAGTLAGFGATSASSVSTDASGNISSYSIIVRSTPLAAAPGETNDLMFVVTSTGDIAAADASCTNADGTGCTNYTFGPAGIGATDNVAGSWTMEPEPPEPPLPTESIPVPALSVYGLALTSLGLMLVALRRLRRQTRLK